MVIGVACGVTIWWSYNSNIQIKDSLKKGFKQQISNLYRNDGHGSFEKVVDNIQTHMRCCGVNSIYDWRVSRYSQGNATNLVIGTNSETFSVPKSCCKDPNICSSKDITGSNSPQIHMLYTKGCWTELETFVMVQWNTLLIIASVLVACQGFALVFSCFLCYAVTGNKDK